MTPVCASKPSPAPRATLVATALVAGLLAPHSMASAGDLGDTLQFLDENLGPESVKGYDAPRSNHAAIGLFSARNVVPGKAPEDYGCGSAVDGKYTLRTNGNERWSGRKCRELRFARKELLPGYQTMGPPPMRPRELAAILRQAEAQTDVPAKLLETIISFQSGRRPGLVSDNGRFGLMQLSPDLLRAQGIEPINLLDPESNVRLGARYVRSLTIQFRGIKMGLAAYLNGPAAVGQAGDIPNDPETLFFVREVMRIYYGSIRKVPEEFGSENMTFIWSWME